MALCSYFGCICATACWRHEPLTLFFSSMCVNPPYIRSLLCQFKRSRSNLLIYSVTMLGPNTLGVGVGGLTAPIAPHFPPPLPIAQSGFFNEDWPRCVWSCCQLSTPRPLSLMPIQQSPQPLQLLPPPPWVQYEFKAKTLLCGCLVSTLKMWRRGRKQKFSCLFDFQSALQLYIDFFLI